MPIKAFVVGVLMVVVGVACGNGDAARVGAPETPTPGLTPSPTGLTEEEVANQVFRGLEGRPRLASLVTRVEGFRPVFVHTTLSGSPGDDKTARTICGLALGQLITYSPIIVKGDNGQILRRCGRGVAASPTGG